MCVVELKAAAEKLAKHLELHNFTCGLGWLWQFRQRHNITNRNICGEAISGDVESAEPFQTKLNKIIAQLGLCYFQIYNDEATGLFRCALPENTQASCTEQSKPG
jgi:hypothetical protein